MNLIQFSDFQSTLRIRLLVCRWISAYLKEYPSKSWQHPGTWTLKFLDLHNTCWMFPWGELQVNLQPHRHKNHQKIDPSKAWSDAIDCPLCLVMVLRCCLALATCGWESEWIFYGSLIARYIPAECQKISGSFGFQTNNDYTTWKANGTAPVSVVSAMYKLPSILTLE